MSPPSTNLLRMDSSDIQEIASRCVILYHRHDQEVIEDGEALTLYRL